MDWDDEHPLALPYIANPGQKGLLRGSAQTL